MDYAEEQRQRWNAGRVGEHDWAARGAPRAPTGLEQHTATLFTGANVSATLAKFLRPVQQIVQRSCRLTTHRETQDRIAIEGY